MQWSWVEAGALRRAVILPDGTKVLPCLVTRLVGVHKRRRFYPNRATALYLMLLGEEEGGFPIWRRETSGISELGSANQSEREDDEETQERGYGRANATFNTWLRGGFAALHARVRAAVCSHGCSARRDGDTFRPSGEDSSRVLSDLEKEKSETPWKFMVLKESLRTMKDMDMSGPAGTW